MTYLTLSDYLFNEIKNSLHKIHHILYESYKCDQIQEVIQKLITQVEPHTTPDYFGVPKKS